MVTQYPHTLSVILTDTEPRLEDGVYVFGEDQDPADYNCRAQLNSKAKTISTKDGASYVYEYLILLPKMDTEIKSGTKVILKLSDTRQFEKVVKQHHNFQLNSKIWI